jgi:hypothetical protein
MGYETCTDRRALALGALAAGLTAPFGLTGPFGLAADDARGRDVLVLRQAPGVPATLRGRTALDWEPPRAAGACNISCRVSLGANE